MPKAKYVNSHKILLAIAKSMTIPSPTGVSHTGQDGKGILITDTAMKQLARLCNEQDEDKVLRVGVRSGGCSGMSYTMDFVPSKEIQKEDEVYKYKVPEGREFHVICDSSKSRLHP